MRKMMVCLSALSLLAGLAPLSRAAEPGVTDTEVAFGSCVPLTGPNKINGIAYSNGAKAYIDYLNAEKGGIHGRKIKLILEDDGYDPEKAIICYKGLLAKPVFATGLGQGTPTAAKYVVLAENNKVPFIANAAGPGLMYDLSRHYVFAVRASYADEIKYGVGHLWHEVGARKFGVIYQNDALGGSVLEGLNAALKPLGGSIVAEASYPRNTTDVDEAIKVVRAADPEVVYIGGVTVPEAEILKKAKAAGWKPIFVPLPARDAELIKTAGDAAEGVVIGNPTPPETQTKLPTVALYHRALKKYVPQADIGAMSLLGFVDAMVVSEGLKRAGKDLTREGLVTTLEGMRDVEIGLGPEFKITYSGSDHKAFSSVYFTTVRGGKAVPIADWKKDFAR